MSTPATTQPVSPSLQLDVVRDDQATRLDADEPASEDVVAEQHLTLAALEVREVEILAGELHRAGSHLGDPVARDEEPASGDPADQSGHGRVATLGEAGDHIVHPAEPSTCPIHEGAAHDPGQCQPARRGRPAARRLRSTYRAQSATSRAACLSVGCPPPVADRCGVSVSAFPTPCTRPAASMIDEAARGHGHFRSPRRAGRGGVLRGVR